jgi:hypothetical protein
MEKNIAELYFEFKKLATEAFFSVYTQFEKAAKTLDRRRDNNVFLQLQAKYLYTLKQKLELLAKGLLDKYRELRNSRELNISLTEEIQKLVNEFTRKSQSL